MFSGLPDELRGTDTLGNLPGNENKPKAKKIIAALRDLFYSTHKNIYELFKVGCVTGKKLDIGGFTKIVNDCSAGSWSSEDIEVAFVYLCYSTEAGMSFEVFEKNFKSDVPSGVEFETVVVRKIRSWMFRNRLSSEMAFDSFCRSTGHFVDKVLSRAAFHEAF